MNCSKIKAPIIINLKDLIQFLDYRNCRIDYYMNETVFSDIKLVIQMGFIYEFHRPRFINYIKGIDDELFIG